MENKFDANELIESRKTLRGDFKNVAKAHLEFAYAITNNIHGNLSCEEEVALNMIIHKLARIITASGYDEDSWKDVAGYATLVVNNHQ